MLPPPNRPALTPTPRSNRYPHHDHKANPMRATSNATGRDPVASSPPPQSAPLAPGGITPNATHGSSRRDGGTRGGNPIRNRSTCLPRTAAPGSRERWRARPMMGTGVSGPGSECPQRRGGRCGVGKLTQTHRLAVRDGRGLSMRRGIVNGHSVEFQIRRGRRTLMIGKPRAPARRPRDVGRRLHTSIPVVLRRACSVLRSHESTRRSAHLEPRATAARSAPTRGPRAC